MMDLDPWIQAVVAILTSGGSLAACIQLAREILKRRAAKKYERGYKNIHQIYQLIQQLLSSTVADRILICKSENGGGIPSPGTDVKSSVLWEVCDSDVQPISDSWQVVPLDQAYSLVLTNITSQGFVNVRATDLQAGTTLRDLLTVAHTNRAAMFRICATRHALLYLSVHYASEAGEETSEHDRVEIRRVLQKLRQIFSKHHQLVKAEVDP
jgi:hypothetical protein